MGCVSVVLAMKDDRLADLITEKLEATAGCSILRVHPSELPLLDPRYWRLSFLETGTDAALLTQIVYELHQRWPDYRSNAGLVPIASEAVLEANPSLTFWGIDGLAAVLSVLSRETVIFDPDVVVRFVNHLGRA